VITRGAGGVRSSLGMPWVVPAAITIGPCPPLTLVVLQTGTMPPKNSGLSKKDYKKKEKDDQELRNEQNRIARVAAEQLEVDKKTVESRELRGLRPAVKA
jgi:hypothetical protein